MTSPVQGPHGPPAGRGHAPANSATSRLSRTKPPARQSLRSKCAANGRRLLQEQTGAGRPFERLEGAQRCAHCRQGAQRGRRSHRQRWFEPGRNPQRTESHGSDLPENSSGTLQRRSRRGGAEGRPRGPAAHGLRCGTLTSAAPDGSSDIDQIAKNCRTSVEMIEKFYAAHIKTNLDCRRHHVMRRGIRGRST